MTGGMIVVADRITYLSLGELFMGDNWRMGALRAGTTTTPTRSSKYLFFILNNSNFYRIAPLLGVS